MNPLEALVFGYQTCYNRGMEIKHRFAVRRYVSLGDMKAEEYRYWQSRPAQARIAATGELIREAYGLKGVLNDESRLQRTIVRLKR